MEGLTAKIVPALAVVLCASAPFFAGASVAQGFGSISSDTPAATGTMRASAQSVI